MPNPVNLATLSDTLPIPVQVPPAPGYGALDFRRLNSADVQEGVVAGGDLKVTQRAAGAGAGVDVAGGQAFVQGDSVTREGLYYVGSSAAFSGATQIDVPAPDLTNPRLDQLVLEVKNDVHDGSGLNLGRLRLITGTPTAGATTANRLGAASLPNTAIRLAEWVTPAGAGAAAISNAMIVDRRPWARGAFRRLIAPVGTNYVTTGTAAAIDPTNLAPRIECSGVPLRCELRAQLVANSPNQAEVDFRADGANPDATPQTFRVQDELGNGRVFSWVMVPAAGSHIIAPYWRTVSGTATTIARDGAAYVPQLTVEELVRQNADNT